MASVPKIAVRPLKSDSQLEHDWHIRWQTEERLTTDEVLIVVSIHVVLHDETDSQPGDTHHENEPRRLGCLDSHGRVDAVHRERE